MKSDTLHDRDVVQFGDDQTFQVPPDLHFPHELLDRADISDRRKRQILAAWASDAHAVESMPTLRHLPGTPFPVLYSSIMDTRMRLDERAALRPRLRDPGRHGSGWDAATD